MATLTDPTEFHPHGPNSRDSELGDFYQTAHDVASTWNGDAGMSGISAEANAAVNNIHAAIAAATRASRDGYIKAKTAANDPRYQDSYNQSEATRIANEHDASAADAIDTADANLTLLNVILEDDARPRMKKGEELTARSDLQFAMSGANDLKSLSQRIKQLASQEGSIGALASDADTIRLIGMAKGLDSGTVDSLIATASPDDSR